LKMIYGALYYVKEDLSGIIVLTSSNYTLMQRLVLIGKVSIFIIIIIEYKNEIKICLKRKPNKTF